MERNLVAQLHPEMEKPKSAVSAIADVLHVHQTYEKNFISEVFRKMKLICWHSEKLPSTIWDCKLIQLRPPR